MYNLFMRRYFPHTISTQDFRSKIMTSEILHFFLHGFDELRIFIIFYNFNQRLKK